MTNYVKNYRKTATTKVYDLLELKANGRIDEDGDYLDDEGNKLTKTIYKKVSYKEQQRCTEFLEKYEYSNDAHRIAVDGITKLHIVETLENKSDIIHKDGFICVGAAGERWCVRRDIFLATYEQKNILLETIKTKLENLLLFANDINGQQITYNDYSYLHDNLSEILDILPTDEEVK